GWYGKNNKTPDWETTVAGPCDRWPTGLGFDYFSGFNAGDTDLYYPVLFETTTPVEPDKSAEEGCQLLTDMTDRAISRMKLTESVAPEKPFFLYFAPGAMHSPHQAPAEWRERFKGKFDMGWDEYRKTIYQNQLRMGIIPEGTELTAHPEWVSRWDTLNTTQKKVYTTLMENYAGYMAFADHEVGRLLAAIDERPDARNTMVIYIVGDNGASSEGGPDGTFNAIAALNGIQSTLEDMLPLLDTVGQPGSEPHYPMAWAWAGNAPFQWVKQVASHLGGTRNPMIVKWPAQIQPSSKPREAFLHVVDIVPTILEAANIPMPNSVDGVRQMPLAGTSFLASFYDPSYAGRNSQYFEILSNRSFYADGWKANAQHTLPWRQDLAPGNWEQDKWELYYLPSDFSESNDLAKQHPEKLKELRAGFDKAAEQFSVYPLDDRGAARISVPKPLPPGAKRNTRLFTYYEGAIRIAETAAPPVKNNSWTLMAKIKGDGAEPEGVVVGFGGIAAGIVLYLDKGVPVFDYNYFGEHTVVRGNKPITGESSVVVDFAYDGGGKPGAGATVALFVDGRQVGRQRMKATVPGRFGADTLGIGMDTGQPVTTAYRAPFP
ncbi:MAG: sulfatase-like hydrolase/transferase, partial [Parahaliea sp.]